MSFRPFMLAAFATASASAATLAVPAPQYAATATSDNLGLKVIIR